ncbi:MAG: tetratricopeptide repeat protein [Candidatus Krumholzibacteriia bacterium]
MRLHLFDMRRNGLALLVVFGATLAVFGPVVHHEFLNLDDDRNVYENPDLDPVTFSSVSHVWRAPYFHLYIPVTHTVWAILASVAHLDRPAPDGWKLSPGVFHAANLALHLVNSLLVFAILKRLARRVGAACAGSLLFALHPVQVEPVAWVTGMKDLLGGFWGLVAIWQYLRYARTATAVAPGADRRSAGSAGRPTLHYAIATVAFTLGLLSKPTTVVVPLLLGWMAAWRRERSPRQILRSLGPWIALGAACVILNAMAQVAPKSVAPVWARPFVAADAIAFYLRKLALPLELAVDYGRTPERVLQESWVYLTPLVPLGILAAAWRWRLQRPWIGGSSGVFVAGILPVLGFVPFGYQDVSTVADRYLYLAMLGPAMALCGLLARNWRKWVAVGCVVYLACLGIRSAVLQRHWRTSFTLLEHALEINPRSRLARYNLGIAHATAQQPGRAAAHFAEILRMDPADPLAHNALGMALAALGRTEEGCGHYAKAIELDPELVDAHLNLAHCLVTQARLDEAAARYRMVLGISPQNVLAHFNLGNVLAASGELDAAIRHLAEAVRIEPGFEAARRHLTRAEAERRAQGEP